jgi:hypothetical protein
MSKSIVTNPHRIPVHAEKWWCIHTLWYCNRFVFTPATGKFMSADGWKYCPMCKTPRPKHPKPHDYFVYPLKPAKGCQCAKH